MDLTHLEEAVQHYCHRGLAASTHKTYGTGVSHFLHFWADHGVPPFPVSESLLCYFVASLAEQGLAPGTTKVYLAVGVR